MSTPPQSPRNRLFVFGVLLSIGLLVAVGRSALTGRAVGDRGDTGGGCGGSEAEMVHELTEGQGLKGNAVAVAERLSISAEEVVERRRQALEELGRIKALGVSLEALPEEEQARVLELRQLLGLVSNPAALAGRGGEAASPAQDPKAAEATRLRLDEERTRRQELERRLAEAPVEGEAYDAVKREVLGQ